MFFKTLAGNPANFLEKPDENLLNISCQKQFSSSMNQQACQTFSWDLVLM